MNISFFLSLFSSLSFPECRAVMAPEKTHWGASAAAKVPTVPKAKNFNGQRLSYWLKQLKEIVMEIMKLATVLRRLDSVGWVR